MLVGLVCEGGEKEKKKNNLPNRVIIKREL